MTAKDYPITTPYGQVPGYPLNNGFHKGVDYGCPEGTPVVVNGVEIGVSGATGYVTGAHLHVGRWSGGQSTDPGLGGFEVSGATVTEISSDPTDGNFIRLADADGSGWVYLHLSNNQILQVGNVLDNLPKYNESNITTEEPVLNKGDVINVYQDLLGRTPNDQEVSVYEGKDWKTVFYAFVGSDEYKNKTNNSSQDAENKLNQIKSIIG